MASRGRRFALLLWKNYLLQRRQVLVTVLEVLLPTLFSLVLIWIRSTVKASPIVNATVWESFSPALLPEQLRPKEFVPLSSWRLFYAPQSRVTDQVMAAVRDRLSQGDVTLSAVVPYASEEAMVSSIMNNNGTQNILGGVVFLNWNTNSSDVPKNLTYKIRLSASPRNAEGEGKHSYNPFGSDTRWFTQLQFPMFQKVGPRERWRPEGGLPGYMREGFLTIQHAVGAAITDKVKLEDKDKLPDVLLRRMPYPPYNDDNFVIVVQSQLPLMLMLSFIFSALNIVKDVVLEKERRIKETLKLMGLPNWMHWSAWFVKHFLLLLMTVSIITVFFVIKLGPNGAIIGYSSPTVLLAFLLVYAMATISFCFAISVFFKKANTGAAAGGIIFFLTYVPYFFLQSRYSTLTWNTKMATSLIHNVAMAYGGQIFGMFEGTGAGVQWSSLNQPASVDDDFTLLQVMLMLLLDTILYALVAWYVEAVYPGEFGIPQAWYFPVLRSYWCGTNPKDAEDDGLAGPSSLDSESFERDPIGPNAGIQIRGLRKEFGHGDQKRAVVAGTTLNLYEGQITALLGHNGAGKTTTINMLTGFLPPSGGTAIVNGYNIRRDIDSVRSSLGLCPQHNVLFDTMTVEEHLIFFALVKGYPSNQLQREVTNMLRAVGLQSKKSTQTQTLSGGQKRKLSVAIALIGGSKVVILDEPTSGMDPNARRLLWDVLQRHRAGRTMLLTTHFMDEADLLGDRVAIMADGVIQCCGSSLFLKNKYGAGYHMVIVKRDGCEVSRITDLVQSLVPAARLESNVSAELSYVLPSESARHFEQLFTRLEQGGEQLGVATYGVSVTTMEEVFLRVGEVQDDSLRDKLQNTEAMLSGEGPDPVFNVDIELSSGWTQLCQQFRAMLVKRMLHTARNWLVTATQLFIPIFFTVLGLIQLKTQPSLGVAPPLSLLLGPFGENVVAYSAGAPPTARSVALAGAYAAQFRGDARTRLEYVNGASGDANDSMVNYLVAEGTRSLGTYVNKYIVAAEFAPGGGGGGKGPAEQTTATAFFNDQGYHTVAVSLAAVQTGLLRMVSGDAAYTLTPINHPLPRTLKDKMDDEMGFDMTSFSLSFNIMFGFSFLLSSFVLFLIKERATSAKHCQFVSGVSAEVFWVSTFLWDLVNYLVPVVLLLVAFVAFGITPYTEGCHALHILLLFVMYGWACLPCMYLMSFLFTVPARGFVWLSMFNILSGIGTVLAVKILAIPQLHSEDIGKVLKWVFLVLLPNFNLGQGLQDFYTNSQYLKLCSSDIARLACTLKQDMPCCKDTCTHDCLSYSTNYLSLEDGGIGRMLIFMAEQGAVYFFLIFVLESGILRRLWYACSWRWRLSLSRSSSIHSLVQEDDDVTAERQRISVTPVSDLGRTHTLVLSELTKYYNDLLAVDRLSFGIRRAECFGLLGVNGAGKTTTFKMLTGDVAVSSGNAYLQGFDIKNSMKQVRQLVGYCPQFDALVDQLTGRETLTMYARIKGVASYQIPGMVQQIIRTLLLTEHADKLACHYSGGNKRKLSAAIALVGDPPVIFLDEPTTGMDPVARRFLWDTLSRLRATGTTLVLTSHSMEECEVLCTQIGVMVNGQLKCFGSTQHLKNKFGQGFTLLVRVGGPTHARGPEDSTDLLLPDVQPFRDFIEEKFPGSVLKDMHQGMLHYHIPDSAASLAQLFGTIEANKQRFFLEDYSVSQTTLEQVFINFARSQVAPLDADATTRCQRCKRSFAWCCCCCSAYCCRQGEEDEDMLDIIGNEVVVT